jgi:hypothetical protein
VNVVALDNAVDFYSRDLFAPELGRVDGRWERDYNNTFWDIPESLRRAQ